MDDRQIREAPNYLNAAIAMIGVNLMWVFFVIWVVWGFVPVLLLALMINHFAERVADRRGIEPAFARIRLNRTQERGPRA